MLCGGLCVAIRHQKDMYPLLIFIIFTFIIFRKLGNVHTSIIRKHIFDTIIVKKFKKNNVRIYLNLSFSENMDCFQRNLFYFPFVPQLFLTYDIIVLKLCINCTII